MHVYMFGDVLLTLMEFFVGLRNSSIPSLQPVLELISWEDMNSCCDDTDQLIMMSCTISSASFPVCDEEISKVRL